MRADYDEEYTLGQEVTEIALGKKPRETTVVSVRLPVADVARLERISSESGKSMSQVIRDAIEAYKEPQARLPQLFRMNIQTSEGAAFAVGPVERTFTVCNPFLAGIPEGNFSSGRWWTTPEQVAPGAEASSGLTATTQRPRSYIQELS